MCQSTSGEDLLPFWRHPPILSVRNLEIAFEQSADFQCVHEDVYICPAAEGRGAFDIVRENVTRSVCLSVSLSLSLCLSIPRAAKREFGTD